MAGARIELDDAALITAIARVVDAVAHPAREFLTPTPYGGQLETL